MRENEPQNLWLYGEVEPWRRGRTILITIFCFYAVLHTLLLGLFLVHGSLEVALFITAGLLVWWLIFAFIWLGTHWLRWLLGAWTMLTGFAFFIWGVRDQSAVQWSSGVINLLLGAFCFAPSVHFFAVRQKESLRWPEKLVVGAAFLILLLSVIATFLGITFSRNELERDARHYGEEALRRIFVQNDTTFLLGQASDQWKNPYGNLAITDVLTNKVMRLDTVENTRVTGVKLQTRYEFPAKMRYGGIIEGEGLAKCGVVLLWLEIQLPEDDWRINGVWWECLNTRSWPHPGH